MTGKELLEKLKKLNNVELDLTVYHTTFEYNGATTETREFEIHNTPSLAGPAAIILK